MKNRALGLLAALGLSGVMVAVGCQSNPPRVPPPTIDPSAAGTAANIVICRRCALRTRLRMTRFRTHPDSTQRIRIACPKDTMGY